MQSLESRRGILIAAGLDALLTQVDLTGAPQEFVADLVNNLSQYGSVAYELALVVFLQEVATQVGEDKQAAMREFLRTVRDESGMLTGWDQEHYGFMHLGFQEYLAAREIQNRAAFKEPTILRVQYDLRHSRYV